MNYFSAKNKIYLVVFLWILLCVSMPAYFFKILTSKNEVLKTKILAQRKEIAGLKSEQKSFELAKVDLEEIESQEIKPENLFSNEAGLVNDLKTLENLKTSLGMQIDFSGFSGTIKTALKADSKSNLVTVPYSISATGNFSQILTFLEIFENLKFISQVGALSLSAHGDDKVIINLPARLFLRKN